MPSPLLIAGAVAGGAYLLAHAGSLKAPVPKTDAPATGDAGQGSRTSATGADGSVPTATASYGARPPEPSTSVTEVPPPAPDDTKPTTEGAVAAAPTSNVCYSCPSTPTLAGTTPGAIDPKLTSVRLIEAARRGEPVVF